MINQFIHFVVLVAALLVGSSVTLSAAESSKGDAALAAKLVTAIMMSDYESFVADGGAPFKQFKKEQFEAVSVQLAPRFQAGHEISYLGELKQKGYRVTLWKISFKDGSDDALATLSLRAGKVGGFFIR